MSDIQIVKLAPEDWQAYKRIRLESLLNEPQAFTTRYEDAQASPDTYWQGRLNETLSEGQNWLLVAKENDRLVGMIGAFRKEGSNTARIISVYVSPDKRGLGVGAMLMDAILAEISKHADIRKAELSVNKTQTPAVALYQRCGFQIMGEEDNVQGDGKTHAGYIMEKQLTPGT